MNSFAPKTTSPTSTTTISTTKTFAWDGCKFTTLGFIQNGSSRECVLWERMPKYWDWLQTFSGGLPGATSILCYLLSSVVVFHICFFLQSKVSFDRRSHARKREAAQQSTGSMGRATVVATAFSGLGLFLSDTCKATQGLEGLLDHWSKEPDYLNDYFNYHNNYRMKGCLMREKRQIFGNRLPNYPAGKRKWTGMCRRVFWGSWHICLVRKCLPKVSFSKVSFIKCIFVKCTLLTCLLI